MNDQTTTLQELKALAIQFRTERNWQTHFTPKNTAISISLEAAELLEHFQWDELMENDDEAIAKELADVIIFCFHFATLYDIDISTVFKDKLAAAAKKYPVENFTGDADAKANYHRAKKAYRKAS